MFAVVSDWHSDSGGCDMGSYQVLVSHAREHAPMVMLFLRCSAFGALFFGCVQHFIGGLGRLACVDLCLC